MQLNKLTVYPSLDTVLTIIDEKNLYKILPINKAHVLNLSQLPFIHKDPFDRLLICQAMTEKLTLLTADENIIQYPIDCIS